MDEKQSAMEWAVSRRAYTSPSSQRWIAVVQPKILCKRWNENNSVDDNNDSDRIKRGIICVSSTFHATGRVFISFSFCFHVEIVAFSSHLVGFTGSTGLIRCLTTERNARQEMHADVYDSIFYTKNEMQLYVVCCLSARRHRRRVFI